MSEKSQTNVTIDKAGPVATIRFVSPNGVNIFSTTVVNKLGALVEPLAADSAVRFVVLRGEGKTFLAGADISEMSQFDEAQGRAFATNGHRVFNAIAALPQVTFAAINGAALGGGSELSWTCDFRLAVKDAKLGQPETRLGLLPGWGGTLRLPGLVPLAKAKRLIFTGETITAEQAFQLGLVDEIVPTPGDLEAALQRWFAALTPASPHAIACAKHALLTRDEITEFARCFTSPEARAGTTAFLEKRKPPWAAGA